jgi:hypothetical protein
VIVITTDQHRRAFRAEPFLPSFFLGLDDRSDAIAAGLARVAFTGNTTSRET